MTDSTLSIRPATPKDADTILELIRALAIYEREPDAVEVTADVLAQQLSASDAPFECLIAEVKNQAAGFALFFRNYSTWRGKPGLWLEDLFVLPQFRQHGVGRALLQTLAQTAVSRGWARMEWSVLDWNELAIGFYERLGATAMNEWTTHRLTGTPLEELAGSAANESVRKT